MNLYDGKNKDLIFQIKLLEKILLKNETLKKLLDKLDEYNLENYYVAAGAINQTVFNYYHGYPLDSFIEDYDIVYYDDDTSYEKEDKIIKDIYNLCDDLNIKMDIKNQARVHLWYENKFGHEIEANLSVEDAIGKWGSTVTCIGVRKQKNDFIVFAPYGLNDLYSLTIRPVKKNFTKKEYDKKVSKWKNKWPNINVIPWDNN